MANPYLNDAFFEAMRRQLREQVEGQRLRASRGVNRDLDRRGLFGESTVAAQAHAGVGGASTKAIGEGETAIEGMEFKRDLERFIIEQQKPSALEVGLKSLGEGAGAALAFAGGGGSPASQSGSFSGGRSAQDPFGILGQGGGDRDYLKEAQERYRKRKTDTYRQAANVAGRF